MIALHYLQLRCTSQQARFYNEHVLVAEVPPRPPRLGSLENRRAVTCEVSFAIGGMRLSLSQAVLLPGLELVFVVKGGEGRLGTPEDSSFAQSCTVNQSRNLSLSVSKNNTPLRTLVFVLF